MLTTLIILFFLLALIQWADLPTATNLSSAGVLVSGALPTAAALTQTFTNTGKELVLVQNGSGGGITATIVSQIEVDDGQDDLTVEDQVVTIAAGATRILGPFKPSVYNDADDKVTLEISAITTVTVQAVKANTFGRNE